MIHSLLESYMRDAVTNTENLQKDGSVNWSFVDADCFMDVGHYFKDQNDYMESFNEIAGQIEAEMNPVSNEIQLEMEV
tara:strand:- start:56 stop:289 length:234 start_codon:yes stop_codon:yes gene_type:complete